MAHGPNAGSNRPPQVCRHCGAKLEPNRLQCYVCKQLNIAGAASSKVSDGVVTLAEILTDKVPRYFLDLGTLDRNFGGEKTPGIALPSVTLIGGGPGMGKSTLWLQLMARMVFLTGRSPLYVGAEEPGAQIKDRAHRLGIKYLDKIKVLPLEAQGDVNFPQILRTHKPCIVIVDSIQHFEEDQEAAIRMCLGLKGFAGSMNCPFVVVGQVTKDGDFEGRKKLQHAVDTLLFITKEDELELEDGSILVPSDISDDVTPGEPFRLVETDKNRYGPSGWVSHYVMTERGLIGFELPKGHDATIAPS